MELNQIRRRFSKLQENVWARYAFAVLIVGVAFGLRLVMLPLTGTGAPFVLFFGAVLVSSFYGGRGPGFLALVLGGPLGGYFFVTHAGYALSQAIWQVLMFSVEGVLVTFLASGFVKSKVQLEQSAREAKQAVEEARRATQMRDDFVAVVSHDLKNPLCAIDLKASLLMRPSLSDLGRDFSIQKQAEAIKHSARRMKRLIDDLLDLAKIEGGRFTVEPAEHSVDSIIDESLEALEPLAEQKMLRLEKVSCPDSCQVLCDRDRIMQVLLNLIGNAIKFTAEGGLVVVRASQRGNQILFEVKDSGPGIPEGQLPYIFDRYWQARQAARQGTGLGLSIAKGIIEAHSGKIWVESKVGEGSTFFFILPAAASAVLRFEDSLRTGTRS